MVTEYRNTESHDDLKTLKMTLKLKTLRSDFEKFGERTWGLVFKIKSFKLNYLIIDAVFERF